jgi:hypothetical protein
MRRVLGVLTVGACFFCVGAASASTDACMTVAAAKYQQWLQPRVLLRKTKTFSNGSVLTDEIIVTIDTAYVLHRGHWWAGNIGQNERGARSPEHLLMNMGLANCEEGKAAPVSGQPARLYSYSYSADRNGFVTRGAMWISDATGLPLREELHETAPPANPFVATAVETTYAYNADVHVPLAAENADSDRLFQTKTLLEHLQMTGLPSGKAH